MTRIANREKAVEIPCCFSSQSFRKSRMARNGPETDRVSKTADEQALGRKFSQYS